MWMQYFKMILYMSHIQAKESDVCLGQKHKYVCSIYFADIFAIYRVWCFFS